MERKLGADSVERFVLLEASAFHGTTFKETRQDGVWLRIYQYLGQYNVAGTVCNLNCMGVP